MVSRTLNPQPPAAAATQRRIDELLLEKADLINAHEANPTLANDAMLKQVTRELAALFYRLNDHENQLKSHN